LTIESGQLRRWRNLPEDDPDTFFIVLEKYSIPLPGADWVDDGWWVLTGDRTQWVAWTDIEDDSDLVPHDRGIAEQQGDSDGNPIQSQV
jgi:hypothetical protein